MFKEKMTAIVIQMMERGLLPDRFVRAGIRKLLKARLSSVDQGSDSANAAQLSELVDSCKSGPIAPVPEAANQQHYEMPASFFPLVLGEHRKYSSCLYASETDSLNEAEANSLAESCAHAQIENGMSILELGCGWGSLTLWLAKKYPDCQITAVSNSNSQREYIVEQARSRGIDQNLTVITADMNDFQTDARFDRICSIEMFEHMRNYRRLLKRVSQWLNDDGKLFVHIFCHRKFGYEFQVDGASNWMGRYFFTGGIMPSQDLFAYFDDDMQIAEQWMWNGRHYAKTADDWIANMDRNKNALLSILKSTYGSKEAARWFRRWRILFMAGSELFGFNNGEEWFVSHYLFEKVRKTESGRIEREKAATLD